MCNNILKKNKISIPFRYRMIFLSNIVIASGSILFHSTIQRWAQLLDELPMLLFVGNSFSD